MLKMSTELGVTSAELSDRLHLHHVMSGQTMGTRYCVEFYASVRTDIEAIRRELQQNVDLVDQQMSPWIKESDLNRLNSAPLNEWIMLPDDMFFVVKKGLAIGKQSDGCFDIGLGALTDWYGFGPDQKGRPEPLKPVKPTYESLILCEDYPNLVKKTEHVQIDLCGIAKGHGVDRLAATLEKFAIHDYLVSIDGELRVGGCKPGGNAWTISIEQPNATIREPLVNLELRDITIATSGDYRHQRQLEDRTISHTMDINSFNPVQNDLASVTVAAETCAEADAWATALMVMGADRALIFAQDNHMDVFLIARCGDSHALSATGNFKALVL